MVCTEKAGSDCAASNRHFWDRMHEKLSAKTEEDKSTFT